MDPLAPDLPTIRYDRQILIKNWNQDKIRKSRVVIVGMGALGTIVSASLAMAGVGELILVDYDTIEITNLNRQLLFHTEDIGKSKVMVGEEELNRINPDLKITPLNMRIQDVPTEVLESATVIVEGLDTFQDRRWVNSYIVEKKISLVSGGMFGFLGNLQVVQPRVSACLECQSLIPEEELQKACTPFGELRKQTREEEPDSDKIPSVSSVSFVIGGLMAQETLKIILDMPPIKEYLFWDGTAGVFTSVELARREDCFVCSEEFQLHAILVSSAKNQLMSEFVNQLRYSFNLGVEMRILLGASTLQISEDKVNEIIKSGDILRVIDPALSKPLKFKILLDT
ncbi:MAG: HesA/MoeB/ThiF family protein [Candidatus Hodarchaeales archaeon]